MDLKAFKPESWIDQLYKKLKSFQKKKNKELDEINDIMYGDPLELAKYYVEPDCQEINPADRHEEDFLVSREPIHKKIKEFFQAKKLDQPGNNQMFILSDAGMGKTSLLVMLKLRNLTSFWPQNSFCVLKKLGKRHWMKSMRWRIKEKPYFYWMPLMKTRRPMDE